jgi:hypothetical protein
MAGSPWAAWIEILPDFKGFGSKANQGVTGALGAAGTAGSSAFGKSFLGGIGQVFGGTALTQLAFGAGRVIGDAISSAVNFGLDGIQLASSLGEQANAVKVSFGEISDEILALAEDAPTSLNLTRASFDKLAVRFSSFAKTIAGQGGSVSKVIDQLTKRGADFASVYDLEVSDALELFQSGLAGETEPLRRFGVDLSEASVKAFAYANGIAEQGKQLTEAQKIQARYGSLLAQTNQVTGDLANTSGSLANQQRQLKVGFEEAQTALGEALLPGMTALVGYANTNLIPKFKEVIDVVGPKIAAALDAAAPAFERMADKAGPLLDKLVTMGTDALPGVLDGFDQIVDAAPGWIDAFAWANDPNAQPAKFLNDLAEGLNNAGEAFADFFGDRGNEGLWDDLFAPSEVAKAEAAKGGAEVSEAYIRAANEGLAKGGISQEMRAVMDRAVKEGFVTVDANGRYVGVALVTGIAAGINSSTAAEDAAKRMAQRVTNSTKFLLGIKSPSKVFAEIGSYVGLGFAQGVESQEVAVNASLRSLITIPSVQLPDAGTALVTAQAPVFIDPQQMQELLQAFKVELLTDDVVLATSTGRGAGFSAALGAS